MHSIDWDDLRYILAVAEAGSLAGAARRLRVNHTTVLRRINAFEAAHGVRLFERLPTGYALTAAGEELLGAARSMSEMVDGLERRLKGQDLRLEGTIRVTTTDTLIASILPPILAAFSKAHPGITLEISVANVIANLTRRDADVAIRPAASPPPSLIGRKVADVGWAFYAAARDMSGEAPDIGASGWIAPDDTLSGTAYARWLREDMPEARIAARSDSFVAMARMAEQGAGIVALPCYLGDLSLLLRRVENAALPRIASELWVLTHEDLRRAARITALTRFLGDEIAALQTLIAGGAPRV
jgi:DNA-binding transcriptional LysR family regulator